MAEQQWRRRQWQPRRRRTTRQRTSATAARERAEVLAAHEPLLYLVEERLAALRQDLLANLRVRQGPDNFRDKASAVAAAGPQALEAADGLAPRSAPPPRSSA